MFGLTVILQVPDSMSHLLVSRSLCDGRPDQCLPMCLKTSASLRPTSLQLPIFLNGYDNSFL